MKAEGDQWCISVPVYLGEIAPAWVRVELYADSNAEHPSECVPMNSVGSVSGAVNGYIFSTSVSMLRPADHYTPRVRAWHAAAFLPAESALIAWQR
ncbi:hypothetical protein [Paraburkholderia phenazinium]|uniref:hypothetical protein n=1 Tax=Paraburkholderia phenazinium TaxID=60549 RepID=UPI001FC873ED|nr:hypothetical protein [Paraburkholderia phenazinium]